MTNNENELIKVIREADDPGAAMIIATKIIICYLQQHGSLTEQGSADLRESS